MIDASPIPDDILDSEYFLGTRVLMEQAKKLGFAELESEHGEFRDGYARFRMAVDWDVVRDEIAGKKVPSFIAAEFWYGNNSGAKPPHRSELRQARRGDRQGQVPDVPPGHGHRAGRRTAATASRWTSSTRSGRWWTGRR